MTGQINSVLSKYGHPSKSYESIGKFTDTWEADGLHYKAIITIIQNGKTSYNGTISLSSTTETGQDNPTNLPIGSSEDPIENPDKYAPIDKTGENTTFIRIGNIILGTIRALGTVIAVVALMVIGLRYMFGSLEERANYKETMIPYLIGAVMLFTIPNILGIIYDLVKGINIE